MTDTTYEDGPRAALELQLHVMRGWKTPTTAAAVLAALTDPVAQTQEAAFKLEAKGDLRGALDHYEAIAGAFAEAMDLIVEEERPDLESFTEYWNLIVATRRGAIDSKTRPDDISSRTTKYQARPSRKGFAAPEPPPSTDWQEQPPGPSPPPTSWVQPVSRRKGKGDFKKRAQRDVSKESDQKDS